MNTNAPQKKVGLGKHLALIWGGGILLWPTLTALAAYPAIDNSEAFVPTMMVALGNVFLGWIPALLVFLVHWGIRGWINVGKNVKASLNESQQPEGSPPPQPQSQVVTQNQGQAAQITNEPPITEAEMLQRWAQMNPHGCCMNHRDEEG